MYLAFGATRLEACRPVAQETLRLALTPPINQMRCVRLELQPFFQHSLLVICTLSASRYILFDGGSVPSFTAHGEANYGSRGCTHGFRVVILLIMPGNWGETMDRQFHDPLRVLTAFSVAFYERQVTLGDDRCLASNKERVEVSAN